MTKDNIHQEIKKLIEKIKVQNEHLEKEKGNIHALETDLLRKYCMDLYDLINSFESNLIDKINLPIAKPTSETKEETLKIVESDELNIEEKLPDVVVKTISESEKITENKEQNLWNPPKFEPINEKPKTNELNIDNSTKPENKQQVVINELSEQYKKSTLHDTISKSDETKEMLEKFANSKIDKIIASIDISKRFELQQNLFKSDNRSFTDAINRLEKSGNLETALRIFDHLAKLHHWDMKNELVKELKSLVYRRY